MDGAGLGWSRWLARISSSVRVACSFRGRELQSTALTRLPPPARCTGGAAARLLSANFPDTRFLGDDESEGLLVSLADNGITGGQVHDALVGAGTKNDGIVPVPRDRRAADTYRSLDVNFEILG